MSYSLLSKKRTLARRQHGCCWCGLPVLLGSVYVREKSTYDGHFQNFAWHEACLKDGDEYFQDGEAEFFTGEAEMPFRALYELERTTLTGADNG